MNYQDYFTQIQKESFNVWHSQEITDLALASAKELTELLKDENAKPNSEYYIKLAALIAQTRKDKITISEVIFIILALISKAQLLRLLDIHTKSLSDVNYGKLIALVKEELQTIFDLTDDTLDTIAYLIGYIIPIADKYDFNNFNSRVTFINGDTITLEQGYVLVMQQINKAGAYRDVNTSQAILLMNGLSEFVRYKNNESFVN